MRKNKPGAGRPITAPSPWRELYKAMGSHMKVAEHLGVSKATVGKWAFGIHRIPALAKREVIRLCKEYGIEEGVAAFEHTAAETN